MHTIYEKASDIFADHLALNERAMVITQALGYNGLKRKHEMNAKHFYKLQLCLAKDMFDKYRKKMTTVKKAFEYSPMTLKEHFANWDLKLDTGIKELGILSKDYFEKTGMHNKSIKKAIKCMLKDYEKNGRWYHRGEETSWSAHDNHVLDTRLHAKMKNQKGGEYNV